MGMQFFYQEHSLKSGIYKIVNTHTNRIYIGQAKRFKERWSAHRYQLRTGKHQNPFLLADFRKCQAELGHDDFLEFHVLELMEGSTREQRNEREESWIAQFYDKGIGCYNLQEKAAGESKNPGELKVKRSQQLREQWRDPVWRASTTVNISKSLMGHVVNEVTRQNMSKAHKGKPNGKLGSMHSDEAKSKIGQAQIGNKKRAKTWEVALIAPDGTIYEGIDCLAEFAKQHDLHKQDLHKVVTGKRLSCKGWKLLVL